MTINHHPSDESLLRYAAGSLSAGPAVVISAHLETCGRCRAQVADFETIGGQVLEDMAPGHLAADALTRVLERLEMPPTSPRREPIVTRRRSDLGIAVPASLLHCEIEPWRWLGPGFRRSRVTVPGSPEAKVMFLKGRAGLKLPSHGHAGTEFMQILFGSLSDERGRYGPGDLIEADGEIDHQPVVDPQSECICVVAIDGNMRFHGLLGQLLQPLTGF